MAWCEGGATGNGLLNAEELMQALAALGVAATADSAEHLLERIHDVNRGGNDDDDSTVTLTEFASFYRDRVCTLQASFDSLLAHAHEHGSITADGLRRALKDLDLTVSREDVCVPCPPFHLQHTVAKGEEGGGELLLQVAWAFPGS
jgi:Ca2+-binding EF-hand superfamily protein